MNSAKPILTSLFLILTFVLSAQTYTKLSDGSTIPPGKSYYILPKGSFIIEIPIVTSKLIKGARYNKDFNEDILKFANEKIGLDIKKYSSLKPDSIKDITTYSISDDSIKISMKAVPDDDKVFYLNSKPKWNKNQSVTFNYVDGGILTEGEVSREDKTFDILVKGLSAAVSIASVALTGRSAQNRDKIKSADSLLIIDMAAILEKITNQGCCDNHEVYKDIRAQYEKQFTNLFSQHFYSEKKIITINRYIYTPLNVTKNDVLIPFFSFNNNDSKIYFSPDVENLIWGKVVTSSGFESKTSFKIRFKSSRDQLVDKFSEFAPKSISLAYNVPKKIEFQFLNTDDKIIFNEIFKVPQFGKIGYVDFIKNGKLTYSLDPTNGELLKLSISSTAVTSEQIDAASSAAKDLINTVKGDDATTKLEKEVTRLELEKKKQDLLKSLGQE